MPDQYSRAGAPGTIPALWWGWIIAPTWWLVQFEARYAGVPWACRHGQTWLVTALGGLAGLAAIALAARAWGMWKRSRAERTPGFLALGGAWSATLFALLVLAQLLPDIFIALCRI